MASSYKTPKGIKPDTLQHTKGPLSMSICTCLNGRTYDPTWDEWTDCLTCAPLQDLDALDLDLLLLRDIEDSGTFEELLPLYMSKEE